VKSSALLALSPTAPQLDPAFKKSVKRKPTFSLLPRGPPFPPLAEAIRNDSSPRTGGGIFMKSMNETPVRAKCATDPKKNFEEMTLTEGRGGTWRP
jgi:hypothetical protein